MRSFLKYLVAVAVTLAVAAAVANSYLRNQEREWNERVERVQEFSRAETARADSAVAVAARERTRADSLASIPSVLDTIAIDTLIVQAPDTCAPLVAVIEDLVAENGRLREAYDLQRSAAERLQVSYDRLLVANDSLNAVLDDRPLPAPRWLPSLQVGPQVGVGTGGAYVGVGISISWEVPIPWL